MNQFDFYKILRRKIKSDKHGIKKRHKELYLLISLSKQLDTNKCLLPK